MSAVIRHLRVHPAEDELRIDGYARSVGRSPGSVFRVEIEADVDARTLDALLAIVHGEAGDPSAGPDLRRRALGEGTRRLPAGPRVIDGEFIDEDQRGRRDEG